MKHRLRTCGLQRLLYIIWKLIMFQWNWLLSRAQPLLFRQVWYTPWSPSFADHYQHTIDHPVEKFTHPNAMESSLEVSPQIGFGPNSTCWTAAVFWRRVPPKWLTKHRKHVLGDMDWWKKYQTTTWHVNKDIFTISTGTGFLNHQQHDTAYLLIPNHPKSSNTKEKWVYPVWRTSTP